MRCGVDVTVREMAVGVLVDAQQAEERKCAGAPVAGAFECGVVEVLVEGNEIGQSNGLLGFGHLIGVEVVDAALHASEQLASWQCAVPERLCAVVECGHKAGHRSDFVCACERGHHVAEVLLAKRLAAIDAELAAEGLERGLMRVVEPLSVGAKSVFYIEVDCGSTCGRTNWSLYTRVTDERQWARSGWVCCQRDTMSVC